MDTLPTITHKCSLCDQTFETEQAYLDHQCPATEFTPKDPEHLGEGFKAVQDAALARGAERTDEP